MSELLRDHARAHISREASKTQTVCGLWWYEVMEGDAFLADRASRDLHLAFQPVGRDEDRGKAIREPYG